MNEILIKIKNILTYVSMGDYTLSIIFLNGEGYAMFKVNLSYFL